MARLIKGIDIGIYENGTLETVHNCLIGSPSADGSSYTIGIPKGDSHNWIDKKLSFFGAFFRTIGYPQSGISDNIPLEWDKNITAEILRTNGNCTLYESGTYIKHVYHDILFVDKRGERVTKSGAVVNGSLDVTIYSINNTDTDYMPKKGDIIVIGECVFDFDADSQLRESASMTEFRRLFPQFAVVERTIVADSVNRDYTVSAR